jgi:hypothetical protein
MRPAADAHVVRRTANLLPPKLVASPKGECDLVARQDSEFGYQTPAEIVEREQERLRAAMWWVLPAFALGFVGLGVAFLGAALENRVLQVIGFGIGVAAVALGAGAVVRTAWIMVSGVVSRR